MITMNKLAIARTLARLVTLFYQSWVTKSGKKSIWFRLLI